MATTKRSEPFTYVTWITGLLSGEKHCGWCPWLLSHFKIVKRPRTMDLAQWTADHAKLVAATVTDLLEDGWDCQVEDQNDFKLRGEQTTLAGKPDIIATRPDKDLVKVVDCKTGRERDSDYQQVLIYMFALPVVRPELKNRRIAGALVYRDRTTEIAPEELNAETRTAILARIREAGGPTPPRRVPSASECRFCDVTAVDCPDRIEPEKIDKATATTLF